MRNSSGGTVPLASFTTVSDIAGPYRVPRYNLYPAAEIDGVAAPGFSQSQAIAVMDKIANEVLPDGFTTEVSPAATAWWRRASRALKTGHLLTIDYGLDGQQFFAPERKNGTIRAYHRHHSTSDLLLNIGEQDLTAHVDWTAAESAAMGMMALPKSRSPYVILGNGAQKVARALPVARSQ